MAEATTQLYAVIRADNLAGPVTLENIGLKVTVTRIVSTEEEAEAQVARLNALQGDDMTRYFWQATRFVPSRGTQPEGMRADPAG